MSTTRADILRKGVQLWSHGIKPTTTRIASEIGVSHAAVLYHFANAAAMLDEIARHAVETGDSRLIVQLCAINHKAVAALSTADRERHFSIISGTSLT